MSAHLPGAQSGGMQPGSSGSTSTGGGGGGGSTSSSSSQLHSSQAVNGQVAAAIAGAAVAGLLFVMIAIFFVVTRKRKKDGLVYHTDGSYYMHSGQLVGSNHPSGVFYGPPPPGASGGFSYGPLATPGPPGATDSFRGAGYYRSGSLEQQQQQAPPGSNKSSFSYEELTSITSNFARDNVADFGLAKLSNDTHTHVSTRIMGTFGYLAPEYASSGKLTDRSDVFSFGVVLLELITGRKPVDQDRPLGEESLVEWARPVLSDAIERGDHDELVDPRLQGVYNKAEMVRMVEAAAACVRHSAPKRPRMVQVMRALDVDVDEGSMSDLSNGVKVGQSQVFNNNQQEAALEQLRRTAFASEEFTGEFDPSREYDAANSDSRPMSRRPAS
ncbi:hypothetical protein ACQ4PT_049186 [Festuca glaucescens]